MAEADLAGAHAELSAAAVAQLESHIGSADGALAIVVRHAVQFATADAASNAIIIPKRALLQGLLLAAQNNRELNLAWLTGWAQDQGWKAETLLLAGTDAVLKLFRTSGRIIFSRSVLGSILPLAAKQDGRASLAGLVFAVLRRDAGWFDLGVEPDEEAFVAGRGLLDQWVEAGAEHQSIPAEAVEDRSPESLATQSDDPASTDRLGRLPFAQVLAERIREARDSEQARPGQSRAFMVHLHGPRDRANRRSCASCATSSSAASGPG